MFMLSETFAAIRIASYCGTVPLFIQAFTLGLAIVFHLMPGKIVYNASSFTSETFMSPTTSLLHTLLLTLVEIVTQPHF